MSLTDCDISGPMPSPSINVTVYFPSEPFLPLNFATFSSVGTAYVLHWIFRGSNCQLFFSNFPFEKSYLRKGWNQARLVANAPYALPSRPCEGAGGDHDDSAESRPNSYGRSFWSISTAKLLAKAMTRPFAVTGIGTVSLYRPSQLACEEAEFGSTSRNILGDILGDILGNQPLLGLGASIPTSRAKYAPNRKAWCLVKATEICSESRDNADHCWLP